MVNYRALNLSHPMERVTGGINKFVPNGIKHLEYLQQREATLTRVISKVEERALSYSMPDPETPQQPWSLSDHKMAALKRLNDRRLDRFTQKRAEITENLNRNLMDYPDQYTKQQEYISTQSFLLEELIILVRKGVASLSLKQIADEKAKLEQNALKPLTDSLQERLQELLKQQPEDNIPLKPELIKEPAKEEGEQSRSARVVLIDRDRKEIEINGVRKKFKASVGPVWNFLNFLAWINNPQRIFDTSKLNELAGIFGSTIKTDPGSVMFRNLRISMDDKDARIFIVEGTTRNKKYKVNATFEGFLPGENPEFTSLKQLDLTEDQEIALEPLLRTSADHPLDSYIWGEYVYEDDAPFVIKVQRVTALVRQRSGPKLAEAGFRVVNLEPRGKPGRYYLEKIPQTSEPVRQVDQADEVNDKSIRQLQVQEVERIRTLREQARYNLEPLYPQMDYSAVISSPEVTTFLLRNPSEEAKGLLTAVLTGIGASRILNPIVRYSGTDTLKDGTFTQLLTATLVEEAAFEQAISGNRGENTYIFSPEKTAILFRNIWPDKEFSSTKTFGFNFILQDVNVPDGVVIMNTGRTLSFVAVIEAKNIGLGRDAEEVSEQVRAQRLTYYPDTFDASVRLRNHNPIDPLELGRLIRTLEPKLPAYPVEISKDLKPLYFIPRYSALSVDNALVQPLPLTSSAVHAFAETLKQMKQL